MSGKSASYGVVNKVAYKKDGLSASAKFSDKSLSSVGNLKSMKVRQRGAVRGRAGGVYARRQVARSPTCAITVSRPGQREAG